MATHVADCSVSNCSFNDHSNCNPAAITVGGAHDHLMCKAPEVHVGPGRDNADRLTYAHT
ncbi:MULTISPECIES: DUF1540 domain-containing protein [unclassified Arthrobacter]|uniref:DUF1540 domain-containing protein n=1 Tax=unclassified Arthrobacter TaxID=235627 RepID=UPI0033982380